MRVMAHSFIYSHHFSRCGYNAFFNTLSLKSFSVSPCTNWSATLTHGLSSGDTVVLFSRSAHMPNGASNAAIVCKIRNKSNQVNFKTDE
jgi:hypothetical protein